MTDLFTDIEDSGRGITTVSDKEIQAKNEARIPQNTKGQLHGVSDAQKEIVTDVLQGSATDFSGASVESDEPPTKKISECAPKENTAQFNFRNCSVVLNFQITFVNLFFMKS